MSTSVDAGIPFQAAQPAVYVAKVKNVLTGLPPTQAEIDQVAANPAALASLIDTWTTSPNTVASYRAKLLVFFELAFQQTQITTTDFTEMIPEGAGIGNSPQTPLLLQNVKESFARTAMALATSGPLTATLTTHQIMMTPPLMELYAFLDSNQVRDDETVSDKLKAAHPGTSLTIEASQGPIPLAETLDPTNANFMHWYDPDVASTNSTGDQCNVDPRTYPITSHALHSLLYGSLENYKSSTGALCGTFGGKVADSQFTAADFSAWKMVTIRTPHAGEATTQFYDVPSLRSATELVLSTPRVGFFTTPAFFANWNTNTSNQDRVTINQTLIVATGMDVDGQDPTVPSSTPGLDSAHSAAGSACVGCHQTLDPTRAILQSTYSYGYGNQEEAPLVAQKGLFAFRGVVSPVTSVDDLANILAKHPAFGPGWAEKLCYYANSQPCAPDDPEFQRIVTDFQNSQFSWSTLVRELLSSPLTTNATETKTAAEEGELVAVARRDHLCAALNQRLGLTDVCALDLLSPKGATSTIAQIATGLPSDGYGRGAPIPILPSAPTLFYRAGVENICETIAQEVVDPKSPIAGAKQYSSAQPQPAIADFVSNLMALESSDPRAPQALTLLQSHFDAAKATGASATDALRSTFVVACLSPSLVGMGM